MAWYDVSLTILNFSDQPALSDRPTCAVWCKSGFCLCDLRVCLPGVFPGGRELEQCPCVETREGRGGSASFESQRWCAVCRTSSLILLSRKHTASFLIQYTYRRALKGFLAVLVDAPLFGEVRLSPDAAVKARDRGLPLG